MEYIDGEDLAKLLRRVGRLPEEKAFQVARETCVAVAAVHDQGLLHLDLKPANIMLDGRGKVRLTDFGLATHDLQGTNLRCGTPQYMSPEQLAGGKVSARSDLFSLGLTLYELFTGRSAFQGIDRRSLEKPSSHLKTLSPLAEQVILDCLQENPEDRPGSAYEVLAKLPGGDPVTAALALGNTPSPEAVANAPIEARLKLATAAVLLATVLLGFFGFARLNDLTRLFRQVPLAGAAPEALAQRARDVAKEFGYAEPPVGGAQGYREDRANKASRPAMYFWYRQSPRPLTNTAVVFVPGFVDLPGWVRPAEPPLTVPGMVTMVLDLRGNLLEFRALPGGSVTKSDRAPAEWPVLYRAAGLDMTRFRPALDPRHTPPVYADDRQAWDGTDSNGSPLRVEAAAFQGRPVYFYQGPAAQEDRLDVIGMHQSQIIGVIVPVMLLIAFTVGGFIAWRHWRDGRANLSGAWRLAGLAFGLHVLAWATLATHVPVFADEIGIIWACLDWLLWSVACSRSGIWFWNPTFAVTGHGLWLAGTGCLLAGLGIRWLGEIYSLAR
jgi:serine/threonine-protein kinase